MAQGQTVVHALGWPTAIISSIVTLGCAIQHFVGTDSWGWDGHRSIVTTKYMSWNAVGHLMLLPAVALSAWTFLMFLRHKKAIGITAEWKIFPVTGSKDSYGRDYPANDYKEAIPAFALQRMLSLKKELPEMAFSVEQLQSEKEELNTQKRIKLPPDPFLIATFRGISCYIDVWNEPGFEGRRTI